MKRIAPLVFLGIALGCGRTSSLGQCPAAYRADPARTEHIQTLLAGDPEAASLLGETRVAACYAPRAPGVTSGRLLLLDETADDPHLAARAAHLLLHQKFGELRTSGDPHASDEVRAVALEQRMLARLSSRH